MFSLLLVLNILTISLPIFERGISRGKCLTINPSLPKMGCSNGCSPYFHRMISWQKSLNFIFDDAGNHIAIINGKGKRHPHIEGFFQNAQGCWQNRNIVNITPAIITAGKGLWFIITKPFQFNPAFSAGRNKLWNSLGGNAPQPETGLTSQHRILLVCAVE